MYGSKNSLILVITSSYSAFLLTPANLKSMSVFYIFIYVVYTVTVFIVGRQKLQVLHSPSFNKLLIIITYLMLFGENGRS